MKRDTWEKTTVAEDVIFAYDSCNSDAIGAHENSELSTGYHAEDD
jgi:hypothetical protein